MYWPLIVIPIATIILIIILCIVVLTKRENGDHDDGGGKQVGGKQRAEFFQPKKDRVGEQGEIYINRVLRLLLRNDEYLLANLLIPLKNGHTSEIDCVVISRKGIFCIETKNWVAHVYGNKDDEFWYQSYDDPYKKDQQRKNPVLQNKAHCEILERELGYKFIAHNVIIFLSADSVESDSDVVYSVSSFRSYFRNLPEDKLTEGQVSSIFHVLSKRVATEQQIDEHKRMMDLRNR